MLGPTIGRGAQSFITFTTTDNERGKFHRNVLSC